MLQALLLVLLHAPLVAAEGRFARYADFASTNVAPRAITVWLPPGYDPKGPPLPVLYMHDAQNVFDPATAYGGKPWGVDVVMTHLLADGKIRPAIVVAVANSPKRYAEYFPARLDGYLPAATQSKVAEQAKGPLLADAYLRFLVTELKPFIDAHYRTATGPADTMIMGSSMGGLISLYAMAEYPQVFGQAAALSIHWPLVAPAEATAAAADADADAVTAALRGYLASTAIKPGANRLYTDHGSIGLDRFYRPYSQRIEAMMPSLGWTAGQDWISRVYPGADHNEPAWRARLDMPLTFLLGKQRAISPRPDMAPPHRPR